MGQPYYIVPGKTLAKVFEAIDPCKDNKSQAVLSLDEKVLDILENTTSFEPFVLLIKIDQTFIIGQ